VLGLIMNALFVCRLDAGSSCLERRMQVFPG
jgi:hypothetical protein